MSKGLEALESLKKAHYVDGRLPLIDRVRIETIEKSLKALEIINKLEVISAYKESDKYYVNVNGIGFEITKEEYDLLKEVLLWVLIEIYLPIMKKSI